MKKRYLVMLLAGVSFAAMSFKAPTYSEKSLSADKVQISLVHEQKVKLNNSKAGVTPVALVTVALAETSAAAVVVATAGAVSWLISCRTELAPISKEYKSILNEVDMRKLDARN
jgi:hypothetical protein